MDEEKPTLKDEKDTINAEDVTKNTDQGDEEIGGFGEKGNKMPEPTRFGDWEVKGRCSDF